MVAQQNLFVYYRQIIGTLPSIFPGPGLPPAPAVLLPVLPAAPGPAGLPLPQDGPQHPGAQQVTPTLETQHQHQHHEHQGEEQM